MNFVEGKSNEVQPKRRSDSGLTSLVLRCQEMWLGYTYAIGMVLASGCQAGKMAHLDAKDWSLTKFDFS